MRPDPLFRMFVIVAAALVVATWVLLSYQMGAGWAFATAVAGNFALLLLALRVSSPIPSRLGVPTFTLHRWLTPYHGPSRHFEARAEFPEWALEIERNFGVIKEEFEQAVRTLAEKAAKEEMSRESAERDGRGVKYGWQLDYNTVLATTKGGWQHLLVDQHCPKTFALLQAIPGFRGRCTFSRLAPRSRIRAHAGDTDFYYRCHLGVRVPSSLPTTGFQVADDQRPWEEGKLLIFCDCYRHAAWNDCDEERVVLLFDAVRPEFLTYERQFLEAYLKLVHIKIGYTGTRAPLPLRPFFLWLSFLYVLYLNVFGHMLAVRQSNGVTS